jgi:hypothetical protein
MQPRDSPALPPAACPAWRIEPDQRRRSGVNAARASGQITAMAGSRAIPSEEIQAMKRKSGKGGKRC